MWQTPEPARSGASQSDPVTGRSGGAGAVQGGRHPAPHARSLRPIPSSHTYLNRGESPNAENREIARIVADHHLTKGYASFWNAGINQYFIRNKVLFIQSGCSPTTGVRPYRWLLNEQVLKLPAKSSFYLFDPASTRCTEADLVHFFGEPQSSEQLSGEKRLLVYSYDIFSRMRSGFTE
jgi:hypothetical protein